MKKAMKKLLCTGLIVVLVLTSLPLDWLGDLNWNALFADAATNLITDTDDAITRAEWLHNLAVVFEMTVEDEIYPDNYFSDLEDTHEYYYDVLLNVNFGVVDVEAGGDVEPDGLVTRSFASHTLNFCLGYQLEDDTYTFSDAAECEYPADAQVAVNREWVELVDGAFCPENTITDKEVKTMLDDAMDVLGKSEIDVNYDSKFTFSSDVIEIEEGTEVEIDENIITIYDTDTEIETDSIFAVFKSGIPLIYKADSVSVNENTTVVTATYIEDAAGEYLLKADAQGEADLEDIIITPAEGVDVDVNYEETASPYSLKRASNKKTLADISAKGSLKIGPVGYSVNYSVKLKNPTIKYSYNILKRTAQITFESDIETNVSFKADLIESGPIESEVPIFNVGIPVIGGLDVCLKFGLSGEVSAVIKGDYKVGASYSPEDNFRTIKNFSSGSFSLEAKISGSAGVIVKLGVTKLPVVNAYIYAEAGGKASVEVKIYESGTPKNCVEFAAYVYANYGATFKLKAGPFSFEAKAEEKIWDSKTSPAKIVKHYEEEKPVVKCTRGDSGSSGTGVPGAGGGGSRGGYYTKYDSAYSGGWSDGDNSYGLNKAGEPVQLFTYSLNADNEATITGYKGNATVVKIPETIDGHTVVAIGKSAFEGENITSVTIPDTVLTINQEAFYNCSNLSSVKLSDSLATLGDLAFAHCYSLTSIEIPASLKDADDYIYNYEGPFYKCSSLKNVTIENGTTKIVDHLFAGCTGLESIEIPDTVTEIDEHAFNGCSNLSSVKLSESLVFLGAMSFAECTSLTSIEIPVSLKKADYYIYNYEGPFYNCSSLKTATIEDGTTKILDHLFAGCTGLKNIEMPGTIKEIGNWAFYYTGFDNIIIPDNITRIGEQAFAHCSNLTNVTFSDTLLEILRGAFAYTGLESVVLPNSITSMGTSVFEGCSSLKTAVLNNTRQNVMEYTFSGCTALESIELPATVTTIQNYAFNNCTSLKEVKLNDGLTTIQSNAFKNCDALTTIAIPDSVTSVGASAFYDCDALTTIAIPDSVSSFGSSVFYDCDTLTSVTLGTGMTSLPSSTFEHCDLLAEIVLPYRVASIGGNAFKDCVKFTTITIPRATTKIDSTAFSYPTRLTINGVAGTYAETFANEVGATFVNKEVNATAVTLNKTEVTLNKGQSDKLVMTVTPSDFTDEVSWKSSDTNVATIAEDGTLVAKNVGTATIKVTVGNVSASCKVTVVQPVTSVNIDKSSVTLQALETYALKLTVNPSNAANKTVQWTSSASDIASIDENGLVTAHKKGEATITAEAQDGSGKYDTCKIVVTNNGVIADSVSELESPHNYPVNCSDFWQYTLEGADGISVTFDTKTTIEDGFDYLYIYDGKGNEVGKYTGTELAGKTIVINDNTVRIQLASDDSGTEWGFKVTEVKTLSEHTHDYVSVITKQATCTESGVKTFTCSCSDLYTEEIPVLGHNFSTEFTVDKEATATEDGSKSKHCLRDGCAERSEVTVIPKLESSFVDSENAKLDNDVVVMTAGITVENLLSQADSGAVIKDSKGNTITSDKLPGTGMVLVLPDGNEHTIVVFGDVEGDGIVSASDARLALRASVGLEDYAEDSAQYKAAKVSTGDTLSAADARLILRASVGLDDPKDWMK